MRLVAALLFVGACAEQPPAPKPQARPPAPKVEVKEPAAPQNRPPQVKSITYEPAQPRANDDIIVKVEATDPDGDAVDIDYQWFVGEEELLHRTRDNLPSSEFKKGEKVHVEVTASDGQDSTSRVGQTLTIANTPPFFLRDPRTMSTIEGYQVEAQDADGDPITYRLPGAPEGMTIEPTSGVLHYKGSVNEPGGDYHITVRAEDPDKGYANWEFGISISPGSAAKKKAAEAAGAK